MKHLLRIDSSLFAEHGVSTQLADQLQKALQEKHPHLEITHRIFAKDPLPHLESDALQALMTPESERTPEQRQKVVFADTLINELKAADALILTAPMYNFSIPSMLKSWFDYVARAGVTFKYTDTGAVGLLEKKKVYVISTRGGVHKDKPHDTEISLIRTFLGFLGLTDIEVVYAEGLNMGEQVKQTAIQDAERTIQNWIAA
jgi:FMN-dependent NADH-azoreductase